MRQDLAFDAVFQRGDDRTSVRIVLGIGRKDELDIERQAQLESTDLHVALLQDVEQGHLDARLQIR